MVIPRLTLIYLLLFLSFSGMSQQSSVALYEEIVGSSISISEKQEEIQKLLRSKDTVGTNDLATLYFEYSKWNWRVRKNKTDAVTYALEANDLLSAKPNLDPELLKRNLYNLGTFYKLLELPDLPSALFYLDQLISISDPMAPRVGKAYKQKGDIYDKLGDFQKALENYAIAESIHRNNNDLRGLRTTYINTSKVLATLEDNGYAEEFYVNERKIDPLRADSLISPSQEMKLLINRGIVEATGGYYENSLHTYGQALEIANRLQDSVYLFTTLNNIGATYIKMEDFENARRFHERSSSYAGDDIYFQSVLSTNLADLYLKNKEYVEALTSHNEAMGLLLGQPLSKYEALPAYELIEVSPFKRDILDLLIEKGVVWLEYYRETSNEVYLKAGLETLLLADKVVDLLCVESREELSKLFWRKKGAQLYQTAVTICYELGDSKTAFYFMEKNRGLLLLENITEASARHYGGIPSSIIEKERTLIQRIKTLEFEISETQNVAVKDSLRSQIYRSKDQLETFIQQQEKDFPVYYELKKGLAISSVEAVQNTLGSSDHVLEYMMGDEAGYVLWISKSGLQLRRLDFLTEIRKDIELFREYVTAPLRTPAAWSDFRTVAFRLYQAIVPFEEIRENEEFLNLTIIPDGRLQYIPFEAMITSRDSESDSYLLKKARLHYEYSLSLQVERRDLDAPNSKSFIGFVMEEFKEDHVPSLLFSEQEKGILKSYFGDRLLSSEKAKKDDFLRAYNENAVIHISSHGGVSSGIPWIAFYDKKLQLDELYFAQSTKELVVLSACKTSYGMIREGEGVFSLTRGFINSGAKSVVASLWDINERSSSELLENFYHQLKKRENKAEALHKAKLAYLDAHANTSEASPFFWSSIILTGDTAPVNLPTPWTKYVWGVLPLAFFAFILFRRKKRTASS